MGLHEAMLGCRICQAVDGDSLIGVTEAENENHEKAHVPPSTAHYLRTTGRVVRLNGGNRWTEREPYSATAAAKEREGRLWREVRGEWDVTPEGATPRIEPSGHLTTCEPDPGYYDSECPACRSSLSADGRFRFADGDGCPWCHCGEPDCPTPIETCDECQTDGTESLEVNGQEMTVEEFVEWLVGGDAITDEAYRLVMGDRQSSYSHPAQDFRATGRQWGALVENWLRSEGHDVTIPDIPPRVVALMMAALKASRESQRPKHDNRVDGIGYWLCADRVVEGY